MKSISRWIGQIALKSMLYEVSAAPKPGLVDRLSANIHTDMDFYTFIDSAATLQTYFEDCFDVGLGLEKDSNPFLDLKSLGIEAEKAMFVSTEGINTHKGLIFALGLITASIGANWRYVDDRCFEDWLLLVLEQIPQWLEPFFSIEMEALSKGTTYGSQQYHKTGALGARGQALSGYLLVRTVGIPELLRGLNVHNLAYNEAMLSTLLHLIVHLDDSNVLGKHGEQTLLESQSLAKNIVEAGDFESMLVQEKYKGYCRWSLERGVSHGGAADLLVVCVLFEQIFREKFRKRLQY